MTMMNPSKPLTTTRISIIDLEQIFQERDRRKFLIKFETLVRNLNNISSNRKGSDFSSEEESHDININKIVENIKENLIHFVSVVGSDSSFDYRFETLLFSIPWADYLFIPFTSNDDGNEVGEINRLNIQQFTTFFTEYVHIFPNKSEKFIENWAMMSLFASQNINSSPPCIQLLLLYSVVLEVSNNI